MEKMKTPEEAKISVQIAQKEDLEDIEFFLNQPKIDGLFSPKLSDPVRGISIKNRVLKKFDSGVWIVAKDEENKILGCMAIVPAKIDRKINNVLDKDAPMGVSLSDWSVNGVMELSTVATDPDIKSKMKVKGVGENLLREAIKHVSKIENCGFVTDSWIGGDMDGFITHVLNKIYTSDLDYLIQIFKDVSKRGANGPLTTMYLIPTNQNDVTHVRRGQEQIGKLRDLYNTLK